LQHHEMSGAWDYVELRPGKEHLDLSLSGE
jgi:hypothetical protein